MDEQNTTTTTTTTATIADLKTAFEQAVEERKIIDAKIAEIKKQIQAQRKQYEDLDKKTDIYTVTETSTTPSEPVTTPITIPDVPGIKEIGKGLLNFLVKYLIPIILILALIGVYLHRNSATHTSCIAPIEAILTVSAEEASQTLQNFLA